MHIWAHDSSPFLPPFFMAWALIFAGDSRFVRSFRSAGNNSSGNGTRQAEVRRLAGINPVSQSFTAQPIALARRQGPHSSRCLRRLGVGHDQSPCVSHCSQSSGTLRIDSAWGWTTNQVRFFFNQVRNWARGLVFRMFSGRAHPRRAVVTPKVIVDKVSVWCESVPMASMTPASIACRTC